MARPTQITLKKMEQASIMRMTKKTSNARRIAEELNLPRYQVMAFLESKGIARYSDGSYK